MGLFGATNKSRLEELNTLSPSNFGRRFRTLRNGLWNGVSAGWLTLRDSSTRTLQHRYNIVRQLKGRR